MMNGFNYDQTDIHLRYNIARRLPDETLRGWMELIARHMPAGRLETILDIGCGTGRFTGILADYFSATVHGIDPSRNMLSAAVQAVTSPTVRFQAGRAEEIPLPDHSVDLVFLSMVVHHIGDKEKARDEFRRVLKDAGRLCVRISTREQLDTYPWIRFFPSALALDRERIPSSSELCELMERGGFALAACETVQQLFAGDMDEYAGKIGMRAISTLQAISDDEFMRGMEMLREYCDANRGAVYEQVSMFVFRKGA